MNASRFPPFTKPHVCLTHTHTHMTHYFTTTQTRHESHKQNKTLTKNIRLYNIQFTDAYKKWEAMISSSPQNGIFYIFYVQHLGSRWTLGLEKAFPIHIYNEYYTYMFACPNR